MCTYVRRRWLRACVANGLQADEIVLRGGRLTSPTLLTGLEVVEGRQYVRLGRRSPALCLFLTAKSQCVGPLAGNAVLDQIAALRQDFVQKFGKEDINDVEDDKVEDLGLDASDESLVPTGGRSRRNLRVVNKTLPSHFEARLARPGKCDWTFRMLCERGNKAPCIEATTVNFEALFQLVSDSHAKTGVEEDSPAKQRSRRSPRGDPGAREYWLDSNQRLVKIEYEDVQHAGAKRRRTVTRRSSNPALLPLVASSRSPSPQGPQGPQGELALQDALAEDLIG